MATVVTVITNVGAGSLVIPSDVTSMLVEGQGPGNSGNPAGWGGGGGAYAASTVTVTPGSTVYYNVGATNLGTSGSGATPATPTNTWFNTAANSAPSSASNGIVAAGAPGYNFGAGAGAPTSSCVGTTLFAGGGGFTGNTSGTYGGGGGGGGSTGAGATATSGTGGSGGSPDGGAGGSQTSATVGTQGASPGGGGAGSLPSTAGGVGQIRVTYTSSQPTSRPWVPTDITSATLLEWFDPNKGLVFNGGSVLSWTGRVGGYVATQATSASQPTFLYSARNGKPGLVFTNQSLQFVPTGFPSGSAASTIAIQGYQSTSGSFAFYYGIAGTNAGQVRYIFGDQSSSYVAAGISGTSSNVDTAEAWLSNDRCVIAKFSGTTISFNVDGKATESGTPTPTMNTTLGNASIGSWPYYGTGWGGTLQSIVILAGSLSTTDEQFLEGFSSWSNGLAGSNLPSGHPYKSAAPMVTTGGAVVAPFNALRLKTYLRR